MEYSLGIDLGGSQIAAAIVNNKAELFSKKSRPTIVERGPSGIVRDMAELAQSILSATDPKIKNSVKNIGIGVPGPVDPANGRVISANNINCHDFDLAAELKKFFPQYNICIANDASSATWAEYRFGALKGYDNSILLTLGTGLGGGVIYRGEIFEGLNGRGFEPGHMTLIADGRTCSCGRKGCLESYVSTRALRQSADQALKNNPNSLLLKNHSHGNKYFYSIRQLFNAAERSDKAALTAVNQYIHYLASGIASLICIFQPDKIALGGGISQQRGNFYQKIRKEVKILAKSKICAQLPEIVPADLGNDAGIIGAAFCREFIFAIKSNN